MQQKIVTISNLIATYQERCGDIVCRNSGYSVKFVFDASWDGINEKTARFVWNGQYYDVDFTGDTCQVPVLDNTDRCEVGVYAGDLSTTTSAVIPCRKSVLCKGGQPNPGTGQHYSNEAKAAAESAKASESVATAAAQQATAAAAQADALLGPAGSKINQLDKRVTNIEQGLPPEKFVVDGSTAYSKTVPENVCSSAMITKVGGMSHKSVNLLDMSNCVVTQNTTMSIGEGTLTVTGYIVQNTTTHLVGGKTYTFKANSTRTSERGGGISIECYDSDSAIVYSTYRQDTLNPNVTFTVPQNAVRTRFYFYGGAQGSTTSATYTDVMLNEGSTALPYSPYFEGLRHAKVTEVKSKSANHLDMSNCVATTNTTMVVGEGTLKVTGYIVINEITNLVGGKTYTFKANSTRTSETEGGGISIECYDSNSTKLFETYRQHTLNPNVTFTVPSGTKRTEIYFYGGMANATTSATYTDVMLNEGSTALPYSPYGTIDSLLIPSAVQALPDYGKTGTYIEWRDDGRYFVTPDGETNISDLLPADNLIRVESGGPITPENEHGLAVPTEIIYQLRGVAA